jgi:hypothetical protein
MAGEGRVMVEEAWGSETVHRFVVYSEEKID